MFQKHYEMEMLLGVLSLTCSAPNLITCLLCIFAPIDTVMKLLLQQLKLQIPKPLKCNFFSKRSGLFLHSVQGQMVKDHQFSKRSAQKIGLDLRKARVRLTCGPYAGDVGEIVGKTEMDTIKFDFCTS